jgi:hypothetical protein
VTCRREHHTTSQEQTQGGQRRGPTKSRRQPVARKQSRVQPMSDSLALSCRQLFQRLSGTYKGRERPQLPILR